MKIPRSFGVAVCEPPQDLAVAALSERGYLSKGSFGGVNYFLIASVFSDKKCPHSIFKKISHRHFVGGFYLSIRHF